MFEFSQSFCRACILALLFTLGLWGPEGSVWALNPGNPLTLEAYFEAAQHQFTEAHYKAIFKAGSRTEVMHPGFAGAYQGLLARDGRSPIRRLENARSASSRLNLAVNLEESDPRWRLLRLKLETEMPGWLGLSDHIQEDRAFLDRLRRQSVQKNTQIAPTHTEDWLKFYKKMIF
jgi:hypothetical protein